AAFEQGQAEYNLGHFDKALHFYEEAYKFKAVPALLFNIAQCHRQLGDMKAAGTTYKAFLRTARASDPNRGKAQALLAEVEAATQRQQQAQEAKPLGPASDGKQAAIDSPPEIEASAALTEENGDKATPA